MKKRLSTLAAIAVGATFVVTPSAAHAAEGKHCWANLDTGRSACFSTFAEVVADISDGKVTVTGGPAAYGEAQASAVVSAAAVVSLGQVYEDASYGGASYLYTAGAGCDASTDVDHQVSLAGTAWNDRITSFKSFSSCETKLWSGSYAGTGYGWYGNVTGVSAAINDQASSIQWR